jgi:CheY-like chemotaxis protein
VTGPFGKSFSFGSLLQHNAGTNRSLPRDVLLRGVFAVENILILVIEDDPEIQAIIDEALCEGGYEPALAVSGEEAVTLLKGGQIPYRVLVTDINLLGRIDGWEVAKQAREIDPNFPVIYMTGAAADQWPSTSFPTAYC